VETQPSACAADCQHGRGGRSQVHQKNHDMSQAFKEVRRVRVEASKVVDEAKKVQEPVQISPSPRNLATREQALEE